MHRIEAQQMGVGLDRAEVVDPDHFDILAAGLGDRPQHVAADAAKSVDGDPDCHSISPQKFKIPAFSAGLTDFQAVSCTEWAVVAMHHIPDCSAMATAHSLAP